MKINENVSLKDLNTFGVAANTKYLCEITNLQDIEALFEWRSKHNLPALLLGGGSNLLFKNDFEGLIAKVCLSGKDIAEEDDEAVYVSAAGGENWHEFVRWTINKGFAGLENLSLIPGCVGAAPIQNIGAYGVELSNTLHSLQAVNLDNGDILEFDNELCKFGYRESFFKSQALDKLLITSVTFRLPKKPEWHINYAGLREALEGEVLTADVISQAVISERQRKLPDPAQIGNAGSFFKNPVLKVSEFESLKSEHGELPGFPQNHNHEVKTSAGWLIDQCGWKGHRVGDAGVSDKHALVLVNHGNATGTELWQIAEDIIASVEDKFGITLEPEPRVIK
ncbi:UDP-N-acetylmuramate dehydrogenase [Cocleimonas sp. KMM 6892]|uniref:UDP-N-acetylmuramate dehydrogenase n=1 Tax=unclassified Cocleimonas TaxID=2639732 RepID=UPI002DBDFCF2|nr:MULTISPECIES: UDP-N-acetylmuramate dehydrogenase [unclassified Cocleimonas]MEB8433992.1 UDP-N-acetylmuramate dehydrogenase [Cocleimonas sp. KMM 6892]MEC4716803.1 UDP-N-acetylmuramate dehydrogenase [Cocleimonas sp. KMM 6895]MEC4746042.1 UDP-N-acetylmuramate dehydrogenase [Cocleimonas sp. KMM 6896]